MSAKRGPQPTIDRVRRLLVMLPWLMEQGEVPVAEVASRFAISERDVVRDLELAAMCGLPPFVDEMIDVFIDEGMVYAGVPRLFTRPLRLTAPEAFALLAAARVSMEMPGADADGPLARALRKLEQVVGDDALVVEADQPPAAAAVVAAANTGERLRITYWSPAGDRRTERDITPLRVFADRGNWYVVADDHRSGEERMFRIDRIEQLATTGIIDPVAPDRAVVVPSVDSWYLDTDLPTAVLRVPAAGAWVAERYPTRSVERDGDGWRIEVTVASETWLAELLLRLGEGAMVLEPAAWSAVGRNAAAELLTRYER